MAGYDQINGLVPPVAQVGSLLRQASEVLDREARNLPLGLSPASALPLGLSPSGSSSPPLAFDKDLLRRQAHQLIETLLITFSQATAEQGLPAEDKVPLLQCEQPVAAGAEARARFLVANEETTESSVNLYCTDFVSDSGHEIPSVRVSMLPKVQTIAPHDEAAFEIRIAVPLQAAPGTYSGLIQAAGSKYVKAVLSVDVV